IVAHASAPRKVIWLHNDLVADAEREVNGVRPHFQNLTGVFKLYRDFDALVSVSPGLNEINRENLANYAPAEKFVSARNTINIERIKSGSGGTLAENPNAGVHSLNNLGDVITVLGGYYPCEEVCAEATLQRSLSGIVERGTGTTFVTVASLSPENNHARLIRAFAHVAPSNPGAKMVIIGEGPIEMELKQLVCSMGIL